MRIAIHERLDDRSRYGAICHELAHIYLGHLGTDKDIKTRLNRGRDRVALAHQAGIKASRASASLIDANATASTRVRAADSVLDHSAKAIEIEDIEARSSAWVVFVARNQKAGGR